MCQQNKITKIVYNSLIKFNQINNRLVPKIKDGYELELQILEAMKLFCSTKKRIDKTKNGENAPNLEVAEVILVRCKLAESSEVLYTFTPNKSYAYLLNVEPSNLVFLINYYKL